MNSAFRSAVFLFAVSSLIAPSLNAQELGNAIQVDVALNGVGDRGNLAGFDESASFSFDEGLDHPEPPEPIAEYISLVFAPMEGAPSWFTRFRSDWRPLTVDLHQQTQRWLMTITSDNTGTALLSTIIGSNLESSIPVYLIDQNDYWNLRSDPTYPFTYSSGQSRTIALVVGTPGSAEISFLNPSGQPSFTSGAIETISWDIDGDVGIQQTLAQVSLDGGSNFTTLIDVENAAYDVAWDVPFMVTEDGVFRVTISDHLEREEYAEAEFSVIDESDFLTGVTITSPLAGQGVNGGTVVPISWNYEGGTENVTGAVVQYAIASTPYTTIATITGTGVTASWTAPAGMFTTNAGIRVTAQVSSGTAHWDSNSPLTIRPAAILNESFEEWSSHGVAVGPPDNWEASGGTYGTHFRAIRTGENAIDGFFSVAIDAITPGTYTLYQELGSVVEGLFYTFRCRLLENSETVSGQLHLDFLDSSGELLAEYSCDTPSQPSDYPPYDVSGTCPAGAVAARLSIVLTASGAGRIISDGALWMSSAPPPEVRFTSPTGDEVHAWDGVTTFPITWSYDGTAAFVASARLEVSVDAAATWVELANYPDGSTTSFAWLGMDQYSTDVRFRLTATNPEDVSTSVISPAIGLYPSSVTETFEAGWHLLTLPLEPPDPRVSEVIGDDVTGEPVVYGYTQGLGYEDCDSFAFGEGYWLALTSSETLTVDGVAEMVRWENALPAGWSLVGSGYPVDYTVGDLQFSDGSTTRTFEQAVAEGWIGSELYTYDPATGTYSAKTGSGLLTPFAGAWIATFVEPLSLIVDAPAPGAGHAFVSNGNNELDEDDLIASIRLSVGEMMEEQLKIGFSELATASYDPFLDQPAPPREPQPMLPRIVAHHEGLLPTGPFWQSDIRPFPTLENPDICFQLHVQRPVPAGTEVDFSTFAALFEEMLIAFVRVGDVQQDIFEDPIVTLEAANAVDLQLDLTLRDLSSPSEKPELPVGFSIDSAYPNPFNSTVFLRIGLPLQSDIHLAIYDIQGRWVTAQHPGQTAAGFHTLHWTPAALPSGIYFVQISTSRGDVAIRKVAYIK